MMRRLARLGLGLLAMLGIVVVGYLLAAWIGSSIPQNSDWEEPADGIDIMVETNGVHTGIVVPIVSAEKDWSETFPTAAAVRRYGEPVTHLAIGWGEREVFLNVPTWGDLSPLTALRIATVGGDSVIRVSSYVRPAPDENYRPVRLTRAQYGRLVAAIERALPPLRAGEVRQVLRGSYADDAYYAARGTYTMVNNCNSWVGDTLAEAGIPMGTWTPMAGGVMKWVAAPESSPPA